MRKSIRILIGADDPERENLHLYGLRNYERAEMKAVLEKRAKSKLKNQHYFLKKLKLAKQ